MPSAISVSWETVMNELSGSAAAGFTVNELLPPDSEPALFVAVITILFPASINSIECGSYTPFTKGPTLSIVVVPEN